MATVRRLSKGSNASLMDFESDEELAAQPEFAGSKGLNALGKRRVSIGKQAKNPNEQARIADMYKTVIKLAAENKITAKNSWNLELIDHMGALIKEDGADRENRGGVNFQKASCTLDASVKIYSHRVDDTWSSSFRILENLSRSNQNGDEEGEEGVKNPARVGSKSISNRLNLTSTIEKNPSNLNGEALDSTHTADPMFHKMSQAFDEGGAKGMLMANLRVNANSSSLAFSTEGAVPSSQEASNTAESIDVSDLILHSGFTPLSLAQLSVTAALDQYRETIGIEPSIKGCLPTHTLSESRDTAIPTNVLQKAESFGFDQGFQGDDDDNDMVCDMFDEDNDAGFAETVNIRRSSIIASPSRETAKLSATPRKSGPLLDPLFDSLDELSGDAVDTTAPFTSENTATIIVPSAAAVGNEYSYFDANSLQKMGCSWAGARHWKLALRSAIAKTSAEPLNSAITKAVEDNNETTAATLQAPKPKGNAKLPVRLNFNDIPVDILSLIPSKGKRGGDSTMQTNGAIEKAISLARAGALQLPQDAQFTAKDLCRLFLRPRLIVPPNDLKETLKPALMRYSADSLQKIDSLQTSCVANSLYGEKDFVWGSFASDILSFKTNENDSIFQTTATQQDDFDEDNGLYEGFGDDDDFALNTECDVNAVVDKMKGLSIDNKNLLQASRVVQKVDIGYATVAKRVNVKKLKQDLWSHLEDTLIPSTGMLSGENSNPVSKKPKLESKSKPQELSFQDVINDISQDQHQKDVSLSFYFICLLHLANEKNLEISAFDTLSDLRITKPN